MKNNQKISNRPLKENENSVSKTTETLREIRITIISFQSLKVEDGQAWQHPSFLAPSALKLPSFLSTYSIAMLLPYLPGKNSLKPRSSFCFNKYPSFGKLLHSQSGEVLGNLSLRVGRPAFRESVKHPGKHL